MSRRLQNDACATRTSMIDESANFIRASSEELNRGRPTSRRIVAADRRSNMNGRLLAGLAAIIAGVLTDRSATGQAPADRARAGLRQPAAAAIPRAEDGHPDLQGVWLNRSATPLERPKALEGRATLSDEEVTRVERCLTYGIPRLSGTNTGAGPLGYHQIVQTRSYVVLLHEAIHEARIIRLDGRPHLPQTVRQWRGDSLGHWDENTLIVDTTNFLAGNNFIGSSDRLHLIERLMRVESDRIDYAITVDDATTWTKPWTAVIRLKKSGERLFEYACHEGNYEILRDMFAAARAARPDR